MNEFVCPLCKIVEVVSSSCSSIEHVHGGLIYPLKLIQGGPLDDKETNSSRFIKELQLIEFDPNKVYLILFNPVDININHFMKILDMSPIKKLTADTLFVPCKFSMDSEGYQTEMLAIESLDIIEEWLKERKAAVKRSLTCTT